MLPDDPADAGIMQVYLLSDLPGLLPVPDVGRDDESMPGRPVHPRPLREQVLHYLSQRARKVKIQDLTLVFLIRLNILMACIIVG